MWPNPQETKAEFFSLMRTKHFSQLEVESLTSHQYGLKTYTFISFPI